MRWLLPPLPVAGRTARTLRRQRPVRPMSRRRAPTLPPTRRVVHVIPLPGARLTAVTRACLRTPLLLRTRSHPHVPTFGQLLSCPAPFRSDGRFDGRLLRMPRAHLPQLPPLPPHPRDEVEAAERGAVVRVELVEPRRRRRNRSRLSPFLTRFYLVHRARLRCSQSRAPIREPTASRAAC